MLRFLLIVALVFYILSKVFNVLFRVGSAAQQNRNFQQRKPDGHIHVVSKPKKEKKNDIKGGDYVDFEEVK